MQIEKLQKEIKEKRVIINNANDFILKTQQDIANHFCPYIVGDKVLNKDNEEQLIASIKYTSYKPFYSFKIFKICTVSSTTSSNFVSHSKFGDYVWEYNRFFNGLNCVFRA